MYQPVIGSQQQMTSRMTDDEQVNR